MSDLKNNSKLNDFDFLSETDQLRTLLIVEKIKSAKSIDELMELNNLLQRLIAKSHFNRESYYRNVRRTAMSLRGLSREEVLKKYSHKSKL